MTKAETIIDVPHCNEPTRGMWRLVGEQIVIHCPECWNIDALIWIDPKAIKERCVVAECRTGSCSFSRMVRLGKPVKKGGTDE